jgi:hypothetical protein
MWFAMVIILNQRLHVCKWFWNKQIWMSTGYFPISKNQFQLIFWKIVFLLYEVELECHLHHWNPRKDIYMCVKFYHFWGKKLWKLFNICGKVVAWVNFVDFSIQTFCVSTNPFLSPTRDGMSCHQQTCRIFEFMWWLSCKNHKSGNHVAWICSFPHCVV